ncbi:uncharacterized protein KY384_002256 [Bacidia gigantensis]|uniref:uncharacterized protein n=1 Tax=Bacidia gigantensis TaxID=2732470 RepID=UPI001D0445AB|nr:uncharacterized protein KY384_002256 [Bacidia gigantensis]KAG8533473.1 hypothetical protein KY384_002256 [Bacidia gigantensis]
MSSSAHKASNGTHDHDIPYIPLQYGKEDSESSATKLILALFPHWRQGEGKIEFTTFKDGITNTHGLAPALLARFQNGLLYRFIRGRVCTPPDLTKEHIWRGVAQRIAQWHASLPVVTEGRKAAIKDDIVVPLGQTIPKIPGATEKMYAITPNTPVPNIWTVMQKWVLALTTGTSDEREKRDMLQVEIERSAKELSDTPGLGGNGLIFGHCDLLSANVIIPPQEKSNGEAKCASVAFIDYEYATPSPAAFDLANHFSEWGGFECDYNALPTRSIRRAFIDEYISSYISHTTVDTKTDLTSRLFDEIDRFRGIPGLYWGIWALIQAKISQIDFDYASYADVRLKEYWDWRAETDGSRAAKGVEKPLRERRWAEE